MRWNQSRLLSTSLGYSLIPVRDAAESGAHLLEHARRSATEVGRSVFLDVVDTKAAGPAISLYRHAGWEEVGQTRFDLVGEAVDEIVFRDPPR